MSFNLTVTVTGDDTSVERSGDVPNGKYTIHGHDSTREHTFGVTQYNPDGFAVASASTQHNRES